MDAFFGEFQHLRIQLSEIKAATENFDDNKIIGIGGFGKVYKGELSHFKGRSTVAFKRLDRRFGQGDLEFWKEIMMLSRYTYENLISLLGFCDEDGEKILVYEHASNGSLDHHLSSTNFLWIQRLKICLDAARGLSYLHDDKGTQQRVLHRDIKSSNILLDEYWKAKVSDMGLSKIGPANQQHTALITTVAGTLGYLDPMYMELGILTKESDVYSFGVVLFEVLCGRVCFENIDGRFLSMVGMWKQKYKQKKLDEIILQDLIQDIDPRSLETFSDIAFQCLQKSREKRPTMSRVVENLETALEFQETCEEMKHPADYEKIVKTAVHPLTYKSEEELKLCLSKGILLNGGKTWFSLNENGEHCELISAVGCLVRTAQTSAYDRFDSEQISRFAEGSCYKTFHGIFKAHVKTQFLSPKITYTVNLVFKRPNEVSSSINPRYVGINYRLQGGTKSWVSCLADARDDGWLMAELYQFKSERRNVELEILFEGSKDHNCYWLIEGIEFQPIDKVEQEVLEHDKLVDMQIMSNSDDTYWEKKLPDDYHDMIKWSKHGVKWTTKKELYYTLCKGFLMSASQVWFFLDKSGKRCLMLPARAALVEGQWKWKYQSESRFGEVAFDPIQPFSIVCKIKTQMLSPKTTYACYLVYKLPEKNSEALSEFEFPLKVKDENFHDDYDWKVLSNLRFIYLLDPKTPLLRPKVHQNSHNPLNRPKVDKNTHNSLNRPRLKGIPRKRDDGWIEVQVCEFEPAGSSFKEKVLRVDLGTFFSRSLIGLNVQGIEFRSI